MVRSVFVLAVLALANVDAFGETKEIADGVFMPVVNLGHPDDKTTEDKSAMLWLRLGGTGIDTAFDYHNQQDVGKAVRASGVNRTKVFITTKISDVCTEKKALAAVQENLKQLQMSYVDLLLIHFPCSTEIQTKAAWKGVQSALKQGLVRSIGVSNFKKADIKGVLDAGGTPPAINQCQMSIGSHDDETIAFTQSMNITYEVMLDERI
jgi:2,5-diketo-D-gluconate reductase A